MRIEWDDGLTVVRMSEAEPVDVQDLYARLRPKMARAEPVEPTASWLLGRVAHEVPLERLYPPGEVQVIELPVVVVDLLGSLSDGRVAAKLQLQFGAPGAALLGLAVPQWSEQAVASVVDWLCERPRAVVPFSVSFETPDGAMKLTTSGL